MRMDTRMPLMVQQPDFVNALARSSRAAAQTNAVQDRNALRQLYQTQGADIAAGKPGAINALAGLDPMAALGVQDARQGMAARAEMMEQRRVAAARQTAEYAATLDAREQADLAKRMEAGITRGIGLYQAGDLTGLNTLLESVGEQPIQSLEDFPAVAAVYGDALDALKGVKELNTPPKPGNDYERYTAREQAAGREPVDEFTYAQKKRGPGFSFTGPDGSTFQMGGAAPTPHPEGGLASNPDFQSVPDGVDFSDATGAQGFFAQLGNTVSDAIGAGLVAPENERATQAMENLATNTMIALADGVAGKPSNFLLQEFQKLSSTPNSIWQGEGRTRERLNQTRSMLEQAIMMNQDVANTSETATMRSQARANIARLSRLLSDYDAVIDSFGKRQDGASGATTKSGISWSVVE